MERERITLPIDHLGRSVGEVLAIERALTQVPGVVQAYVNSLTEMAYVVYDTTRTTPERLRDAIDQLGYGPPRAASVEPDVVPELSRRSRQG
jgi:copper chaperone CopZ